MHEPISCAAVLCLQPSSNQENYDPTDAHVSHEVDDIVSMLTSLNNQDMSHDEAATVGR